MTSFSRVASALAVIALFTSSTGIAQTLPLPETLVAASSDIGEALLVDADAREAYFPLVNSFVTQQNQAFCGVASTVMILNAMELPAPAVPAYDPYRTFTQDNVLTPETEKIIALELIKKQGITVDQLAGMIGRSEERRVGKECA